MSMHVFGATDNSLWHSILPDQNFFGDVVATAGTGRPWDDDDKFEDVACAADSEGDLHALVVTSDGRLWHTIRPANGVSWTPFGNVETGGAGNIGTVTAVAAATEDRKLHIVAVNRAAELYRTVWNPETSTDPARFDPRFTQVGTWEPDKGPLELVAASFWSPTDVTLNDVPVLRQGHGSDLRVARLQHMLNLSWLDAAKEGGPEPELLIENGRYDAKTAQAVRFFQANNELPEDGIMTRATWKVFLEWWLSGATPS